MSNVPEDIRDMVTSLIGKWAYSDNTNDDFVNDFVNAIAAALLAERKWCADIARSHMLSESGKPEYAAGYEVAAENIAKEIEEGRQP